MQRKSETVKQAIIQKALSRKDQSLQEIAAENNVGYSTLQRWLKQAKTKSYKNPATIGKFSKPLTQVQKIQVLLETANLDELSIGAYCRERGLYRHHIEEWKKSVMTEPHGQKQQQQDQLLKKLQAENKQLKKDLRRKEKALAESAALLILKKKADLLWGDVEEG
ncbi:MAG: hypothetical protein Tsb005_21590 [Gammaproteobacteria bacterium]